MAELIWKAPMQHYSQADETAFFGWLHSIPGVTSVEGRGRELIIRIKDAKSPCSAITLTMRSGGRING
jgi:hypothetical protein